MPYRFGFSGELKYSPCNPIPNVLLYPMAWNSVHGSLPFSSLTHLKILRISQEGIKPWKATTRYETKFKDSPNPQAR